jgi:hypothetical protein
MSAPVRDQWPGQCMKCGLTKSSGVMGTVLPQCMCDWKMQPLQTKDNFIEVELYEV